MRTRRARVAEFQKIIDPETGEEVVFRRGDVIPQETAERLGVKVVPKPGLKDAQRGGHRTA